MATSKYSIDWKSLIAGFLLGTGIIMTAASDRDADSQSGRYRIVTANSTWIIHTGTGDVWQLVSEQGSNTYQWMYAGRPSNKDQTGKDMYK